VLTHSDPWCTQYGEMSSMENDDVRLDTSDAKDLDFYDGVLDGSDFGATISDKTRCGSIQFEYANYGSSVGCRRLCEANGFRCGDQLDMLTQYGARDGCQHDSRCSEQSRTREIDC